MKTKTQPTELQLAQTCLYQAYSPKHRIDLLDSSLLELYHYHLDDILQHTIRSLNDIITMADNLEPEELTEEITYKRNIHELTLDHITRDCYKNSLYSILLETFFAKDGFSIHQLVSHLWSNFKSHSTYVPIVVREPVINTTIHIFRGLMDFELVIKGESFRFYNKNAIKGNIRNTYELPSLVPTYYNPTTNLGGYRDGKSHAITGKQINQHTEEICLDHLNRLGHTALSINLDVYEHAPYPEFDPEAKWLESQHRMETIYDIRKRRDQYNLKLEQTPTRIKSLNNWSDNKFYFVGKYDTRGRTYLKSFHLDYIGDKFIRAAISLNQKELIQESCEDSTYLPFTPFEWALISLTSNYGKDKILYSDRLSWAKEVLPLTQVDTLEELKDNFSAFLVKADNKPQFWADVVALWDTFHGRYTGHLISQDSASSGAQLISLGLKCLKGMSNTGFSDTSQVPDIYTKVRDTMGTEMPRPQFKKGMIPAFYNSVAAPERVFKSESPQFFKAFKEELPAVVNYSGCILEAWNESATEYSWELPDGFTVITPVLVDTTYKFKYGTFEYIYTEKHKGTKRKRSAGTKSVAANVTHSYDAYVLRELARRCNYKTKKVKAALANLNRTPSTEPVETPNTKLLNLEKLYYLFEQGSVVALEYINEHSVSEISEEYRDYLIAQFEEMLKYKSFEIIFVHDDFRSHPNHVTRMKWLYNSICKETYLGDWFYVILEQLSGKKFLRDKPTQEGIDLIMNSHYSIG